MGLFRYPSKRKRVSYLKQAYKMNPATNSFLIEVSLDNYNEVFNGWDPSPVRRRDLDPEMLDFIRQCSSDIPLKYTIEFRFYLPRDVYNKDQEERTRVGIHNNFLFFQLGIKKNIRANFRNIIKYTMMAISFLLIAYFFRQENNLIFTLFIEGMFVGGWVFLWEAFSLIFFTGSELQSQNKHIKRFIEAPISFEYID